MPVIELSFSRLQKLIGKVSKKQISDSLPFLGLDIESEDKDLVRIEYSPNRPDYSTDYGVALGLQGLLGIKTGLVIPRGLVTSGLKIPIPNNSIHFPNFSL